MLELVQYQQMKFLFFFSEKVRKVKKTRKDLKSIKLRGSGEEAGGGVVVEINETELWFFGQIKKIGKLLH